MITIPTWEENEIIKKEVKSADNRDLGEVQEINGAYLIVKKGSRVVKVPRNSIATFDGDKLYLRATEAEVYAGIYPFIENVPTMGVGMTGMTNPSS